MIVVSQTLSVPKREIKFVYGTSSGPGGQHVNKVETKATLLFCIYSTTVLSNVQRTRILEKLSSRINKDGVLRISSSKHKSQKANREATFNRFAELISEALKRPKKRKKTNVTRAQKKKRLESKKKRSETKRMRGKVQPNSH